MKVPSRQFLLIAILGLHGCATMPPDSIPWLLHRQEIQNAPWWKGARLRIETAGIASDQNEAGLLATPAAQGSLGIPVGSHLGLDASFGFLPTDLKLATPVSFDRFVFYPFVSISMRDSVLLPRKRWHYDPGAEIGILLSSNFALRLTAGSMRSSPFEGLNSRTPPPPHDLKTDYACLTFVPLFDTNGPSMLSEIGFGIGRGTKTGTSFLFRLGLNLATTPALLH